MNADEAIYGLKLSHCKKCEHREEKNCGYDGEPDCAVYLAIKVLKMLDKYEKGLLIELPVPIGGTVYEIDQYGRIYEEKLTKVIFDTPGVAFEKGAIGVRIFTTREAAEKAVAELPGYEVKK